MFSTIVLGLTLVFCSPFVAFFANKYIEQGRRKRAFDRLSGDKFFDDGYDIAELYIEGRETPILTDCYIDEIKPGEVVIKTRLSAKGMTFTGREFEKLYPIWDLSDTGVSESPRKQ